MVEDIYLHPIRGCFDLERIKIRLAAMPDVLLDPLGSGTYLVGGLPEARRRLRDERMADPSRYPYCVLITVGSGEVNVFQQWGDAYQVRSARTLVDWIVRLHPCRVVDGYYNDWTQRVAEGGVDILYSSYGGELPN